MRIMNNILSIWDPVSDVYNNMLQVESFTDNYDGIQILLKEYQGERYLKIKFEGNVFLYRNTNESYLLKKNVYVIDQNNLKSSLFVVKSSLFLQEFHEKSLSIYEGWEIIHYFIRTPQDCIDILSDEIPVVEWQH